MRRGILLVISGPAGAGKGTLGSLVLKKDSAFTFSVSATTREPRPTEIEGVHYYFMSGEAFEELDRNGDFLETAVVHGHRYGTPLKPIMQMLDDGRDILLDVDTQGAKSVIAKLADCVTVFILPPSFDELERRLRHRGTENEEDLRRRLKNARHEITEIDLYRYTIINDEVESAYEKLTAIITAERHSTVRYRPEIT